MMHTHLRYVVHITVVMVSMFVSTGLYAYDNPPLQVNLNLNFNDMMDDNVVLEYQYFYQDVRLFPWKGQQVFLNHNQDQRTQLLRNSTVSRIMLFLRPSGAGSIECVPAGGQSPVIMNNVQTVELVGFNDEYGTYRCELIITG